MKVLPLVPLPHCALRAEVWSIYEQRHVASGNEFYDESRQNVTFMRDVNVKWIAEIVNARRHFAVCLANPAGAGGRNAAEQLAGSPAVAGETARRINADPDFQRLWQSAEARPLGPGTQREGPSPVSNELWGE